VRSHCFVSNELPSVGSDPYAVRVLQGRPVILISYSEAYSARLARPVAERLVREGIKAILVGDEPLPAGIESNPNAKVSYFFTFADMAVFLATPDDQLASGRIQTRQNIIDEHRLGLEREHLRTKLLVFKAQEVTLPSNINPVFNELPADDPDWVVDRVLRQAREWGLLPAAGEESDTASPPQSSDRQEGPSATVGIADAAAHSQALAALNDASAALEANETSIQSLERAELVIAALTAERRSGEPLGIRLANRLFAERHGLRLRPSERVLLLRTWLQNMRADNTPGLVWLKDLTKTEVVELLITLARDDPEDEIRAQALQIVGRIRGALSSTDARALVEPFLASDDFTLRRAGLSFIGQHKASLRALLDNERLLKLDRIQATQLAAQLDLARYPGRVLERFITDSTVRSDETRAGLLAAATRLSRSAVSSALSSSTRGARLLGIELVTRRQDHWVSILREIVIRDSAASVRLKAIQALVVEGELIDDELLALASNQRDDDEDDARDLDLEYETALAVYAQRQPAELRPTIAWLSINGPERYEAAAFEDEQMLSQVRRDLRSDFHRLVDEHQTRVLGLAIRQLEAQMGRRLTPAEHAQAVAARDQEWARFAPDGKVGEYLLGRFRRAGLRALAARGRRSDIAFARRLIDDPDRGVALATLELFERFGTSHDAHRVLGLVARIYSDEEFFRVAHLAFRLAYKKDKLIVLRSLRDTRALTRWAVTQLRYVEGGLDEAVGLLTSDDPEIRLAAAPVVWEGIDPSRRDGFLDVYMSYWHYFNVVRWFDRMLYAPAWIVDALPAESNVGQ
jgi:hypothetical protein